jgi:hypothetical protein
VKKGPLFWIIGIIALATIAVFVVTLFRNIDKARLHSKAIHAISVGHELIETTNSTMLTGVSAEFKADLASILATSTLPMLDRSATDASRSSIRLILTNDQHQALHLELKGDYESKEWRFRLLSYQKISEGHGATKSTKQIRGTLIDPR